MEQITPAQLQQWLADAARPAPVLLDVRETWEAQICALAASIHMPMNSVPARHEELEPAAPTVVICHHGVRSAQVGAFLERQGFDTVINLAGGMHAWAVEVDLTMQTY